MVRINDQGSPFLNWENKKNKFDVPPDEHIEKKVLVDFKGKPHTFSVHPVQLPLPKFYDSLSEDKKEFLNGSDYAVFSAEEVNEKLDKNTEKAIKEVDQGFFNLVDTKDIRLIKTTNGTVQLVGSDGSTTFEDFISLSTINNVGVAASCGKREVMEDAEGVQEIPNPFDPEKKILFAGVFDGHNGTECAEIAKNNFLSYFLKRLMDPLLQIFDETSHIFNALTLSFADLNRSYEGDAGSTATISMIINDHIWVANLGDSRTILVTPDETIQLSMDQKPDKAEYKAIIEARGGEIYQPSQEDVARVIRAEKYSKGDLVKTLAPGGSLGDHDLVGAMNPHPDITVYPLPKNPEGCYLVLGCDGVFEGGLSSSQVGEIVNNCHKMELPPAGIAANIVQSAFLSTSSDNMSAIVVPLQNLS